MITIGGIDILLSIVQLLNMSAETDHEAADVERMNVLQSGNSPQIPAILNKSQENQAPDDPHVSPTTYADSSNDIVHEPNSSPPKTENPSAKKEVCQEGNDTKSTNALDDEDNQTYKNELHYLNGYTNHISSNTPTERKNLRKVADYQLVQHVKNGVLTEVRISRLEERLDTLEKRTPSPEPIKSGSSMVPAIPRANFVDWFEFKELRNRKELHHAVDVLRGEPVLWYQRQTQASEPEKKTEDSSSADGMCSSDLRGLPERIRINSVPLINILKRCTGEDFRDPAERPVVFLRPFKLLIYHQKHLRDHLVGLERKWSALDQKTAAKGKSLNIPKHREANEKMETELHESNEAREDLRCLVTLLDQFLKVIPEAPKRDAIKVKYHDLWHLFKPGNFIISNKGPQVLWRVLQTTSGRPYLEDPEVYREKKYMISKTFSNLVVDCYYIDFDGKQWGPCQRQFIIERYEGRKEVTSLDIYPVDYAEKNSQLLAETEARGQAFIEALSLKHMYFKGRTLIVSPSGDAIPKISHAEDVDSPVIVDFDRTLQFNPDWRPVIGWQDKFVPMPLETREMTTHQYNKCGTPRCNTIFCCMNENIIKDYQWDQQHSIDFLEGRKNAITKRIGSTELLEEEVKLLPSRLFGFVLRSRKWASLSVEDLSPIKEDRSGIDALEINHAHKHMIKGLVETHYHGKDSSCKESDDFGFDLVRAKGKGLILLLHGAPGVGKTSTAECVAALHARPLFPITCGDLGMTPTEVETNLDFSFQLAESWGCVLLLDEADVFLAERTKRDVKRNALVSVFLRALEYYRGILFLTTNRVGTIDEAFKSRIHLHLLYPPLDLTQTRAIWTNHLDRLITQDRVSVDKNSILDYADDLYREQIHNHKIAWNGRQIRNAFQTAVALAEYETLERVHNGAAPERAILETGKFKTVAKASVEFERYLKNTLENQSAPEYALGNNWRDDTYQSQPPPAHPLASAAHAQAPRSLQQPMAQYQYQTPPGFTHGTYGQPVVGGQNFGGYTQGPTNNIYAPQPQAFLPAYATQVMPSGAVGPTGNSTTQYSQPIQTQMIATNAMSGSLVHSASDTQPSHQFNGMPQPGYQQMTQQADVNTQIQKQMGHGVGAQSVMER